MPGTQGGVIPGSCRSGSFIKLLGELSLFVETPPSVFHITDQCKYLLSWLFVSHADGFTGDI